MSNIAFCIKLIFCKLKLPFKSNENHVALNRLKTSRKASRIEMLNKLQNNLKKRRINWLAFR